MNHSREITCPVCLTPLTESQEVCACGFKLPLDYYRTCQEAPPLAIAAIGYSTHGKTHLLASILQRLYDLARRPRTLDPVTLQVMDDHTNTLLSMWMDHAKTGKLLDRTEPPRRGGPDVKPEPPVPMILRVSGLMPERTLLVYDVAGEVFNSTERIEKYLPALRDIQTVWFLVSPTDVEKRPSGEVNQNEASPTGNLGFLFTCYDAAMRKLKFRIEDRNAVVILTKCDRLKARASEILQYLDSDPLLTAPVTGAAPYGIRACEAELRHISETVQDYVSGVGEEEQPNAGDVQILTGLLSKKMRVSFCVTSALGRRPLRDTLGQIDPELTGPWQPKRVLDPLIWTLLLEKEQRTVHTHVVLDTHTEGSNTYPVCGEAPLPELLWEKLVPDQQHVRFWAMGRSAPASAPGQRPPDAPPRQRRLCLLGPLLEPLSQRDHPEGLIVLITNNVITDLDDYRQTARGKQLLLVTSSTRREVSEQWPRTIVVQTPEDLNGVIEFLHHLP